MKKKIATLVLGLVMIMTSLFGCGMEMHTDVKTNGKVINKTYYYFTKDELKDDTIDKSGEYVGKKTVDGIEYSVYEQKDSDDSNKKLDVNTVTANGFYTTDTNTDNTQVTNAVTSGVTPFIFTITFPNVITESNGTISEDGKTVTYQFKDMLNMTEMYAYNSEFLKTQKPVIIGISKDAKWCNKKTLNVKGFSNIKSVVVNGNSLGTTDKLNLVEGKNIIEVTNEVGTLKRTLRVDTKKPKVNLKNNKTYKVGTVLKMSDKGSGLAYVMENNSVYSSNTLAKKGYTLKTKGTRTIKVYDRAGNITKIKVKVK